MPYKQFDRSRLIIEPLAQRSHGVFLDDLLPLNAPVPPFDCKDLAKVSFKMQEAKRCNRASILVMGAHVIKRGCSRLVIDLMESGYINHVALNGAGAIHDYELALIGSTTESVAKYIRTGQFGMWRETGEINDIAVAAVQSEMGLGEAIGSHIEQKAFAHRDISILAAGIRLGIPVTVHVGIGQDIIHQHPNCTGAALGETSYRDFLVFTETVTRLEGGVMMCYGSAVMGPEVYLKALSMARNVARQSGTSIAHFTTAVFDLIELGDDIHTEAPRADPRYYYRPYKTILVRTVADGGESYYIRGDHVETMLNLRALLKQD